LFNENSDFKEDRLAEFWNRRKVLITGGCGLIGSYLVEHLLRDGAEVRVADSLLSGSLDNLRNCAGNFEFLELDLQDRAACQKAVRGMDSVFDLAARTVGIGYSSCHHGEMLYDSLMISLNMLEAARQADVERFLVTSSSCVYPDSSPVPTPEAAAERNLPESPNAGYGWAKRIAELQGGYYAQEYGLKVAVVRLVNAYGPRYHWDHEEPHVIPALMQRLLRGEEPLRIWGSGRQTRSFIYGSDVAMLMKLMLERAANAVPVNIGWTEETAIADLVSELAAVAGYKGKILFDTTKPEGPARKGLDLGLQQSLVPDFLPRFSLSEGLRETYAAAREHYAPKSCAAVAAGAGARE
jgi:GDP-L-fucose synthase